MIKQWQKNDKICIIGYWTLCGKILLKKLIKNIEKAKKIYLIELQQDFKARQLFVNSSLYKDVKGNFEESVQFVNVNKLIHVGKIDVLFNMFEPFDWSSFEKSINSHILKTHQLCNILSQIEIKKCVMFTTLYGHLSGIISQNNQQESYITYIPNPSNFKQTISQFLKQNFESDIERWQWSLKFMQHSYRKLFHDLTIIRVPLVGPAYEEGYIDKFNLITYLIYQIGNGLITYVKGKKNNLVDIVPADYVANYFLRVAVLDNQQTSNPSEKISQVKQCYIHNLSTSSRNPLNLQQFLDYVSQGWNQYQSIGSVRVQQNKIKRKIISIKQQLPHVITNRIATLLDIKSWKIQSQKKKNELERKKQIGKKYSFLVENEWICQSNKSIDLFNKMTMEQQLMFGFNVNEINWKKYLKICIYGIKKYILGHYVEGFSSTRMDLLNIQKSSYFSDILWALTAGKEISSTKTQEIKNYILSTKTVRNQITILIQSQALKLDKTPTAYQKLKEQYQNIAAEICDQMFSQYEMKYIRMFAWFLHKTFKTIYEKVVIDQKALAKIRSHDEKVNGPLIIIPTHRSYIDFLIMSYIFFGYGIKCPHIAAAEDFLNMAVIHILLRRSGAFFIKRNQQKYKNLYKIIMTEYISKILIDSHYLEFFIEGTRSRVGKMLSPKFGILSIIARNVVDLKIPDAIILPVTINYEKVLQGSSFTYELMGQPKVKESLSRLIKAVNVLKQNYGRIYIEFCQTISVKSYFANNSQLTFQQNLNDLGYTIVHELSDSLVVSAPAILSTVVLMFRKGISDDSLNAWVNWICKEIASRNIKIARSQSDSSISVTNTLELLGDVVSKSKKDIFEVQLSFDQSSFTKLFTLTYYRNTLTHIFFQQAIVAIAFRKFGYQNIINKTVSVDQLFEQAGFLYQILSGQYVLRKGISNKARFLEVLDFLEVKQIIKVEGGKIYTLQPNGKYFNFYSSLLWPTIQCYWTTLLYFFKLVESKKTIQLSKLLSEIQWFIQSLITEKVLQHIEAVSLDTIKNAVEKYKQMKIIQKVNENEGNEVRLLINQNQLKKFNNRIKSFLKISYAQTLNGFIETGNSTVNLDFSFLSKL